MARWHPAQRYHARGSLGVVDSPKPRSFPEDTDQALQVKALILPRQADTGREHRQVALAHDGAARLAIHDKCHRVGIPLLDVGSEFGPGVSQGTDQALFRRVALDDLGTPLGPDMCPLLLRPVAPESLRGLLDEAIGLAFFGGQCGLVEIRGACPGVQFLPQISGDGRTATAVHLLEPEQCAVKAGDDALKRFSTRHQVDAYWALDLETAVPRWAGMASQACPEPVDGARLARDTSRSRTAGKRAR